MKRTITIVLTAALGLAACGGGDDSADGEPVEPPVTADENEAAPDESEDDTSTDGSDETADDDSTGATATEEEPADDGASDDEPADEASDEEAASESSSSGGASIDSFDDVPPRCRELMLDFLQELEPLVGSIDWQTATAQDFEQIATDFEQFATDFDTESASKECGELDMDADDGFEMLIEYADDVAPDTVPFFEFLDAMRAGLTPGDSDSASGETGPSDTIETCDQMIAGLRELMAEYDSFDQMPLSEITKYTGIGTIMMTCTPEQLELLGSDEFEDFLDG